MDGSPLAECVLPHVKAIASCCQLPVIELVRVVENVDVPTRGSMAFSSKELEEFNQEAVKEAGEYLNKIKERLATEGFKVNTKLLFGHAADSLADYIKESAADLIIISTHGRSGLKKMFWGSVADKLVHSVTIPVMVIHANK
jgi:nucleotide-binding universal stress UspA family protein